MLLITRLGILPPDIPRVVDAYREKYPFLDPHRILHSVPSLIEYDDGEFDGGQDQESLHDSCTPSAELLLKILNQRGEGFFKVMSSPLTTIYSLLPFFCSLINLPI